ncbi:MAG: 50S ribosomal protein L29 [Candidatus Buchananbacteria bacterium RIFCSPHIGHO2_02_FULL_45_11b]|uniref:Large ribosomal subunit protein uL29 n=4 Tax=Candidatus Buchananiibacteriota TaxID=1817903 RepID=A0A1G1YF96_9BACT|nr:MAG: 50S ribosomal protein L29 [Candidatus Buchananbacteria bacterium RIFCSPHIGHO2_01_FULL_46_12]OGY50496.1 MAG: 50S ribosomal protein L29 [Candidatus Buchananbacteria bacterium RIFCSPHIGHO2_02_FULL_45_11b]OGY53454.1 MAG: 50S ribosomal protein L29 [Candidatus Buchananbacteria bacterium RIFCSPLOWO2_01_FULL_45_31]OGY57071.1 MAG: 50S ribosomal protein L29 [Candidatus Buchananbacteria bacterium RIFCSPLOWO2_02_FULL_46_11b]
MDYKELKNLSEKEWQKILGETREKLRDLKFKVASNQIKNIRELREAKKTIARVLFLLKSLPR